MDVHRRLRLHTWMEEYRQEGVGYERKERKREGKESGDTVVEFRRDEGLWLMVCDQNQR